MRLHQNGTSSIKVFLFALFFDASLIDDRVEPLIASSHNHIYLNFVLPFIGLSLLMICLNTLIQFRTALIVTQPVIYLYEKIQIVMEN